MEEQEILFKNTTNMNEECKRDFIQFIWLKYNKYKYWTIMILMITNLLLLGVWRIINEIRIYGNISTSSSAFVAIYLIMIFAILWLPNQKVKKNDNMVYKYDFLDEYMQVYNQLAVEKILYENTSLIKNVCNTKRYIYFMISDARGFIVDKNGFDNYNEEEFKKYIENRFNNKYIDFTDKKNKKQYKQLFKISDIFKCIFIMYALTVLLCNIFN